MRQAVENIVRHPRRALSLALAGALLAAAAAGALTQAALERERALLLRIELQRYTAETMSLTLDGKLMGAISLLGLVEPSVKQDGRAGQAAANAVAPLLESVASAFHAQGVFLVGRDGLVTSSWDDSGKPSTGLQVAFRPYYQTAMRGSDNIYAAISLSRDERALYFAAPVYPGMVRSGAPVGAVVARTGMERVDRLLAGAAHVALLLSPQGVVFAGNRKDWLGWLSGPATPQRVAQIRSLRQFGRLFDQREPRSLPFDAGNGTATLDGRRHAMAAAPVNWNDPAGQWQLVLLEDLSRSVPYGPALRAALAAGLAALLVCLLVLRMLRSQLAQRQAALSLERLAHGQAGQAERKMQLAQAALRLRQAGTPSAVAQAFLSECHRLFGALQGVLYTTEGAATEAGHALVLAAGYACGQPAPLLAPGEGLLGECARTRQARVILTGGAEAAHPWMIQSGLGAARPAALLLAPVLLQGRLLGAVELALPAAPDEYAMEQFLAAVELLAVSLQVASQAAAARP